MRQRHLSPSTPPRAGQIELFARYRKLRVAVVGDFCLDRYLEIDPRKKEISLETGLPVHNVVNVRAQPGAAGTVLNNLIALGIGTIFPVGFCGEDSEGYELRRALAASRSVNMNYFITTAERKTFTYCKPLLLKPGAPPVELSRLDTKNWSPTPPKLQKKLAAAIQKAAKESDAIIVLDQVDIPDTGVITECVRETLVKFSRNRVMLVDSRRGSKYFDGFPLKMNRDELAVFAGKKNLKLMEINTLATGIARRNNQIVIVTLAQDGLIAAAPNGMVLLQPAHPVHGPIDIVGAGDAVTANLVCALAGGATVLVAMQIASAAASVVIHQLGTTGVATPAQICQTMDGV